VSQSTSQYPTAYERADGGIVAEAWKGKDIPVPPAWVKQFTTLPRGTEAATLAKELSNAFPKSVRDVLVRYVKEWPRVLEFGHHLVLIGPRATWKRRQWAAAATANEIIMRYAPRSDVTQQFLSVPLLRGLLPYKKNRFDHYAAFRSKILGAKLLVVEDPLNLQADSEERWFMDDLYQIRANNKLPTITTFAQASKDEGFEHVRRILGPYVAEILEHHGNYRAHF
jgi:hypothetical protein